MAKKNVPSHKSVQYRVVCVKPVTERDEKKNEMLRGGYDPPISRSLEAKRATARQNPMSLAP
jgi:hypothetical protein